MHHPGPPRFVEVEESVELAPRDPDPAGSYTWEVTTAPEASTATLGDDPVEQFVPDAAGRYVTTLSAPDGEHRLTVRAISGDRPVAVRADETGGGSGEQTDKTVEQSGDGGGRPRLSLEPAVETDQVVVRADPRPHPEGTESAADLAVTFLVDDRDDIDRSVVRTGERELRIPVDALPDEARVYAVAVGGHGYSVPDAVAFTRDGDGVTASRPYDPPEWATDAFIYEIYVRSFGGNTDDDPFAAIHDRLDYIESLGVDVIWLTPILENDHAPHGYNITDFFSVASDLGTREEYEQLVEAAHDRGMRVLFDVVCNHSARTHPFFEDAVGTPDSEYRDWYEWRTETEPETYFDWEHIANFNFGNLEVRRHLLDAFDEWMGLVDGFRCDMAWAVPNSFWRELHDRCKERDDEFLLLDETIPYVPDFQAGLFDVHFDSTTYFTLRQIGRGQDADTLLSAVDDRVETGFPDHAGFMLYSENHDEDRYVAECGRDAAEAALGAVFTLPGAPMVYAGQEFGQRGRRDNLAWEHAHESLREHVRRLARVRQEHPALSGGSTAARAEYEVRDGVPDRVTAYELTTGEASAVTVLNFDSEPATVRVPGAGTTDHLTGESVGVDDGSGSTLTVDSVAVVSATESGRDPDR
jgi:cyclomaltodextrinase